MLSEGRAAAVVAVHDLGRAREFYGGTLGLHSGSEEPGAVLYDSGGGTQLLVYESSFAGTNEATAVSWQVDDLGAEVADLKGRGISFEHYDFPGMTRDGDIHDMGSVRGAWFKDPDGNILAVISRGGS